MRFIKTLKNFFGLPAGYTRLEYLASDGNQYIDTEYVMPDGKTMGFESDMMWTQSHGTANFFYGYRSVNSAEYRGDMRAFFIYGANPNGRLAIRYGVDSENSTQTAVSLNDKCKMTFDGTDLKVNGTTYATHSQTYNPANYQPMWLFNCNCTGYYSADVSHFIGRIYRFKIFEDGVTVRDFVPCLDSFGKSCMYDLVERKAHYNKGTGEFTYGRQIIPVKYLQSSGNQYIDTGIKFDGANTKIEVKTYEDSLTRQHSICGDDGNYFYYFRGTGNWAVGYNGTASNIDSYMSVGDNVFVIDKNNVYVNDVLAKTYAASSTVSSYNTLLFNRKTSLVDKGAVTIYYCKMWNNDVLVRDYIPAKDENGIGFLFDKVNNGVYLNAGSDAFITGDNVYQPLLRFIVDNNRVVPAGFKEVEYLETTGTQYIDTGIVGNQDTSYTITFQNIQSELQGIVFGSRSSAETNNISTISPAAVSGSNSNVVNDFGNYRVTRQTTVIDWQNDKITVYNSKNLRTVRNLTTGAFDPVTTEFTSDFVTPTNLYIAYKGAGFASVQYNFVGKIFGCKIWDNGTLVRDFIPCLDPSNVPCLFDKVTKQAFYNVGTGDFGYGHIITPVAYLQSTGTQYVDTGIKYGWGQNYEADFYCDDSGNGSKMVFGIYNSIAQAQMAFNCYGNWSTESVTAYFYSNPNKQLTITNKGLNKVEFKNADWYFNGELTHTSTGEVTNPSNLTVWLFGTNNVTDNHYYFKGRLYRFKIYGEDGKLLCDFIPTIDENGVGYMLDKVNHILHENKGTGDFIVGSIKKEIVYRLPEDPVPYEYKMVNYLESSGTQYIDTNYKPNNNTEYEVKGYMNPSGVFGVARWSGEPTYDTFGAHSITANPLDYYGRYSNEEFLNLSASIFNKQIIWKHTKTNVFVLDAGTGAFYVNQNITTSTFQSTENLWMFGFNNMGTILSRSVGCRIYRFKIWDNGILIRNFVPVVRKSDSIAGMYDFVTKQFFENQGTGTFNYG